LLLAVINPTWEMVASSVINLPKGAMVELSAIVKICKYRRFYDEHYFISMAMEVHDTPVIWIISSGNVPIFPIIDYQDLIYPCLFAFNLSGNMLILFFCML
jgi:hypothetical protein